MDSSRVVVGLGPCGGVVRGSGTSWPAWLCMSRGGDSIAAGCEVGRWGWSLAAGCLVFGMGGGGGGGAVSSGPVISGLS